VSRADDGDDFPTVRMADGMGEVCIPFVDQGGLQGRQLFPEGLKGHFEDVLFLELFHFFRGDVFGIEQRDDHLGQDPDFGPEAHLPPGPQEGDTDLPVGEDDGDPQRFRPVDGADHLLAGGDAELLGDLFLEGGQ